MSLKIIKSKNVPEKGTNDRFKIIKHHLFGLHFLLGKLNEKTLCLSQS
jgi:hypothetical protein